MAMQGSSETYCSEYSCVSNINNGMESMMALVNSGRHKPMPGWVKIFRLKVCSSQAIYHCPAKSLIRVEIMRVKMNFLRVWSLFFTNFFVFLVFPMKK